MAIINEIGDSNYYGSPTQSIQVGDTFTGTLPDGDFGDNVYIEMVTGETYTVTLTGITEFDGYFLQFNNFSGFYGGVGVDNYVTSENNGAGVLSNISVDPANGTISFDVTSTVTGSIAFTIGRGEWADGPATYALDVALADPYGITEDADVVTGLASADNVNLLGGNDSMDGGDGNDTILGANGDDSLLGGAGNDVLNGNGDNDEIDGQAGNDTVLGGVGDDLLSGGADDDSVNGGDGADDLQGGTGADTLDGGKDNDTLDGGDGADLLQGGFGNDEMTGGAGADVFQIIPENGVDTITDFTSGEDSIDLTALGISDISQLSISQSGTDAVIDLGGGNSLTLSGVTATSLTNADFALVASPDTGTTGNDSLTGTDTISGGSGNDTVTGSNTGDTIYGGDDKDRLIGGDGDDSLYGEQGNDKLYGGAGADLLDGGNNNDQLFGGDDGDMLDGGQGNDKLFGDAGDDTLDGGRGRDVLEGGAGADTFVFAANSSVDQITDFEDGSDILDLTALGLTDINDLTITQIGGNVEISLDGTQANTVTLIGTDIADIDAGDFLF